VAVACAVCAIRLCAATLSVRTCSIVYFYCSLHPSTLVDCRGASVSSCQGGYALTLFSKLFPMRAVSERRMSSRGILSKIMRMARWEAIYTLEITDEPAGPAVSYSRG